MKNRFLIRAMAAAVAFSFFSVQSFSAEDEEWYLVTDSRAEVRLADVDYFISADNEDSFSIVKLNGNVVEGVESVTFNYGVLSGIDSGSAVDKVDVFPVLFDDFITLRGCSGVSEIFIYSLQGIEMKRFSVSSDNMKIDLSDLPAGHYLLKTERTSVKLIKK